MIRLLVLLINLYIVAVLIRALFSWVQANPYSDFVRFICRITDPVMDPVRRAIPPIAGRYDVSPIVVIVVATIIKRFLLGL